MTEYKIPISVLMSAFNAEKTIKETIGSVLSQSFRNFEFIIINDGSEDGTEKVISSFQDDRIRLINNLGNLGIIDSVNNGLTQCKGKYICRLDADDICHKDRLKLQFRFMEKNPEYVACGTHYRKLINGKATFSSRHYFHVPDEKIRVLMLRNSPIGNPTSIIRRSVIVENNLKYEPEFEFCEDYAFWFRIMQYGKLHILNRPLLYYRRHRDQISTKYADIQSANANIIRETLVRELVPNISEAELETHLALMADLNSKDNVTCEMVKLWVSKLCRFNTDKKVYDIKEFNKMVAHRRDKFIESNS